MRPTSSLLCLLKVGLLVFLATTRPLLAQEPLEVAPGDRGRVSVPVGRGQIIRFARPVETVLVADPAVADFRLVSNRTAYVFGVDIGRTNVFALDSRDETVYAASVEVRRDEAGFAEEMRRDIGRGPEAGFVGARPATLGAATSIEQAMRLDSLNRQRTEGPGTALNLTRYRGSNQINLRVRFAEVSRRAVRRLGINWQAMFDLGGFTLGLVQGVPFVSGVLDTTETFGQIIGTGGDVDVLLEALEREGVLSVLAEPNLTTVSGKEASFLAGGEFPVPVPQDGDVITVDFRQFGVALQFTPTLLPGERISIEVEPEVSTIDPTTSVQFNDFLVPGLTVRRAHTTVELASGETFAIAGLLQREFSNEIDQVPLFGSLPILGELFKSRRFQRDETELMILITPYLVEATEEQRFTLPGERPGTLRGIAGIGRDTSGLAGFLLQ